MKITYREGEALILAEVDALSVCGKTITARTRSGETVRFPFRSEEIAQNFFNDVILNAGDAPVRMEQTNFDPRLGELLDAWDSLYED